MYDNELMVSIEAAIGAKDAILDIYNSNYKTNYKKDGSPVTEADKKAEEIIVGKLKSKFPEYGFLAEESVDDKTRLEKKLCFIIDPLDGTKEFIAGNGEFTINIALSNNNKTVMGVILIPCTNEIYYATKDKGAYMGKIKNNVVEEKEKINVSNRKNKIKIVTSRSNTSNKLNDLIKMNNDKIDTIKKIGSSIKGCLIAKGEYDVYYRFGYTYEWDTAAMQCIVEEAGGLFLQMDKKPMSYNRIDTLNRKGFFIVNNIKNIL